MNAEDLGNIQKMQEELTEMRREFHQVPELASQETETSRKIAEKLESYGIEVRKAAGTGIIGIIRGKEKGKTIAYRADIDALPIEEKTGLPFASRIKGRMHACGHDGHITIALGLARFFSQREIKGEIRFLFQPAEEATGGALRMIEDGALEGVNAITGCHIWSELPEGKIGLKDGALFSSCDDLFLKILGKGGHGAQPHRAIDAIVIASSVIQRLQLIASRELDPIEPFVLTIGKISGGYAQNVIADAVELEGTVRTYSEDVRGSMRERIEKAVRGITESMGGSYDLRYIEEYPVLRNDPEMTSFLKSVAIKTLGGENVISMEKPVMGSEDMAFYLERVPGCFALLGANNPSEGMVYPNHSPFFNFDESILRVGVTFFASVISQYLES